MKQKYSKIILWVALVLHILIIFSFSIQNAKQSTVVSEKFAGGIKSEEKFYKDAADEKKDDGSSKYAEDVAKNIAEYRFDKFENFLRKVAHFTLFFILGTLINMLLGIYGIKGVFRLISSVLYSGAIAFFDETIQLFLPGRAGEITDILTDSFGAASAAILFIIGGLLYEKYKIRRHKMDS